MKILGLMMTYNNLHFFKCALKQAVEFCDEVVVVEGGHLKGYPQRSEDGTCEYVETIKDNPKITVRDFEITHDRYDILQCELREKFAKESSLWEHGNWILQWDDDIAFFDDDLPKIKDAMKNTSCDTIRFRERRFLYNFRFNTLARKDKIYGIRWQRITEGSYYTPVSHFHYKNGLNYIRNKEKVLDMKNIVYHHYPYAKPSKRVKFRWELSKNKNCIDIGISEAWDRVSWSNDEDIFNSMSDIRKIIGKNGDFNIYTGPHPETVSDHPWKDLNDTRTIGGAV